MHLGGNGGGRDRGAPWKPVALKGAGAAELFRRDGKGRNEVGSRRVRLEMPRPKGDHSFATRRVRGKRRLATE